MSLRALRTPFVIGALLLVACSPPRRDDADETCTPDCVDRACGDDGCGGSCGSCSGATPRCANHTCHAACTPSCGERQCGDDGCEGTCGTCINGTTCTTLGLCAAPADGCAKGCPEGQSCDAGANTCKPGCQSDANCVAGKKCDFHTHACVPKPELCNGLDDDADGRVDEDFPTKNQPCDGPDADQCAGGTWQCSSDGQGVVCQGDAPKVELCNGVDDDCDGDIDENFPTKGQPCDGSDSDTCANGTWACSGDGRTVVCANDVAKAEVCNGVDDDCDGKTDVATRTVTTQLPGATWVMAAEATNGILTLLVRTDTGAELYRGPPEALVRTDTAVGTYFQDGVIDHGNVAVLFTNGAASVWWGTSGHMHLDALPDRWTLTSTGRDMGGVVGITDGKPVAMRVTEGSKPGTTGTQVERVAYRWDGSAFQSQSLYVHRYQGGNVDAGGIAGLGGGKAVAFVRDEWSNQFYQGEDIRCSWFSLANGTWTAGDSDSMCDPVGGPIPAGSSIYALSEPWGGTADTLKKVGASARGVSDQAINLPQTTYRAGIAADETGRVHLFWMDPAANTLQHRRTSGGPTTQLGGTFAANTYFAAAASGDELFVVLFDQSNFGGAIANVRVLRQLACQ